jgi:hypothetical protein
MKVRTVLRALVVTTILAVLAAMLPQMVAAAPEKASGRYLVKARSAADYAGLRAKAVKEGARVLRDLPALKAMVVSGTAAARTSLAADRRTLGVARDRVQKVAVEEPTAAPNLTRPGTLGGARVRLPAAAAAKAAAGPGINPDPAWDYKGLLWDYRRIGLPQGWRTTAGSRAVTVAVSDTGLDFTHPELAPRVKRVVDLTTLEDPPLCETLFGVSDQELAAQFGGPVETDWYGHGSWIGGNIAAALDGKGVNGIAPKVNLVSLKIAQWCGFSYATTEIASFITAADLGVDVVNISFGGYLDRSDPEAELIYQAYVDAVAYARSKGTIIVAAAGNEHLRIGAGGRVLSHGPTVTPGTDRPTSRTSSASTRSPAGSPVWSTSPRPTGWSSRPRPPAHPAPSATPATPTPPRPSRRTSTPPASPRATPTRRPGRARRTSWPTTRTTARGSTWPARVGPASSTCPTSTGAAPPGSPTPPTT